ncbi:MAG: hypothetical protein HYY55_00780 [Candidatus Niyogibacteria bacterium]|nr:MAG: hypothetical protein HYY55_00780 [Candidatus Niyogibacteria bacterium]
MHKVLENHIKRGLLANGYLLIGKINVSELTDSLKKRGEVFLFDGVIGIEEARQLKEKSLQSVGESERSFFILNAAKISRYVPQAVLKTIEDALPGRHFLLLTEHSDTLPQTLRSRLVEITLDEGAEKSDTISEFVKADYISRSKMIMTMAEDPEKFSVFLDGLERRAMDENRHEFILKIRQARESSAVFNIGRKMCLEYLTHLLIY